MLDAWTAFQSLRPEGAWKSLLSDGLHLSPSGQELLYSLLIDVITRDAPAAAPDALLQQFPSHGDIDAARPEASFARA